METRWMLAVKSPAFAPKHPVTFSTAALRNEKTFLNPPGAFRGKPFWSWNGLLERDELLRQIGVMKEMGMGGAFMHARNGLRTKYLGQEWFDLINACADESEKQSLEAWIYDEDRWPSGSAGGMATANPAYRLRYVRCVVLKPGEKHFAKMAAQPAIARFAARLDGVHLSGVRYLRTKEIAAKALLAGESLLLFKLELAKPHSFYNGNTYLDTMNPAAVRHFIKLTHEKYRKHCGKRLGRSIQGVFTDEPHHGFVMCKQADESAMDNAGWVTPWTGRLPAEFKKRFGYDLRDRLPELFFQLDGARFSPVKWHYMELLQTLFLENWAKPLQDWCRAHGLQLTGHVLHEDSLGAQAVPCGSVMRYYPYLDVPGVDVLGSQNRNYNIAKQLVSVARQQGQPWRLTELYGCTGWQMGFAGHKEIGDWQAVLGINVRCHHLSWYSMAGEAKRDYPASISFQSAWSREYRFIEDYFSRLHVALHRGREVCDVLVIHPVETMWAQIHADWATWLTSDTAATKVAEDRFSAVYGWLLGSQIDFDYGDEEHLARLGRVHRTREGVTLGLGHGRYKAVLVAGLETVRSSTLEKLEAFRKAGGKVIFAGAPPTHVNAEPSTKAGELAGRAVHIPFEREAVLGSLRSAAPQVFTLGEETVADAGRPLLAQVRRDGDEWIIVVVNTATEGGVRRTIFNLAGEAVEVQAWDCRTGEKAAYPFGKKRGGVVWAVDFQPLEEKVFVVATRKKRWALEPQKIAVEKGRTALTGPFAYSLDEPNIVVLDTPEWKLAGGAWQPAQEILKIDETLRKTLKLPPRSGMMLQPWARPAAAGAKKTPLKLRYRIELRTVPSAPMELFVEQAGHWNFQLNGKPLALSDGGWFVDPCLRRLKLPSGVFQAGANVLEASVAFGDEIDLETMYLGGKFGVYFDGVTPQVGALPEMLTPGDVTKQGLPFYSGRIGYRLQVGEQARRANEKIELALPAVGGAIAVFPGRNQAGTPAWIAWPGQRVDLTAISDGTGEVVCEVVLTRRNLLGPLHLVPKEQWAYGPDQFRSRGKDYSDEYQFFPAGLLAAPELITSKATAGR